MSLARRTPLRSPAGLLRQAGYLAASTASSQVLLLLVSPLITRLYPPAAFGDYAVFIAVVSTAGPLATLRYDLAIALPATESDARALRTGALYITVVVSVGVAFATSVFQGTLSSLGGFWTHPLAPIVLSFAILFIALNQIGTQWSTRIGDSVGVALSRLAQGVASTSTQLLLPLLFLQSSGLALAFGAVAGYGLADALLAIRRPLLRPGIASLNSTVRVLRHYIEFPKYTAPASLINLAGVQAAPIALSLFHSPEAAGNYALTTRLLGLPVTLISQAVGQLFHSAMAKRDNASQLQLLQRAVRILSLLSLGTFGLLFISANTIFSTLFGAEWRLAGDFARMQAPWFAGALVASPLSSFALVRGKNGHALLITAAETGLRLGGLGFGVLLGSAALSVVGFSIAGALITLYYVRWLLRLSGSSLRATLQPCLGRVAAICAALLVAQLLSSVLPALPAFLCSLPLIAAVTLWAVTSHTGNGLNIIESGGW